MARPLRFRQVASATLLVGVVLGVVAAPASASTAQLVELPTFCKPLLPGDPCGPSEPALVYQAGGEANRVTVEGVGGGIRITDPGAAIEPGKGCSRVAEDSVDCSSPGGSFGGPTIFVAAGGGADRVRVTAGFSDPAGGGLGVGVDGGPGSDLLVGGPGPDQLFGGAGGDRLRGRGGDDVLHDVSRQDFLPNPNQDPSAAPAPTVFLPAGRSRDSYDGGAGTDRINYEGRLAKLRINLANTRAIAGARGEGDAIRGVEDAVGGDGADRIAGNRLANQLIGARGNDVLSGRAGADNLEGREGNDVIRGGPGNDGITINFPNEGGADRISCGSGNDGIGAVSRLDLLSSTCERIGFYIRTLLEDKLNVQDSTSLLPLRGGRPPRVLRGNWSCSPGEMCQARAELRVRGPGRRGGTAPPRGTLLGSQALTVGPALKSFELSLSADGLRSLRRHRALRVQILLFSQHLRTQPLGYVTLLRAP